MQIAPLLLNEYFTTWEESPNSKPEKGKKDQPTHLLAGECFKACVEYPFMLYNKIFLCFIFSLILFNFACEVVKQESAVAKLLDLGYPLSEEDFSENEISGSDVSKHTKSIHVHLLKFEVTNLLIFITFFLLFFNINIITIIFGFLLLTLNYIATRERLGKQESNERSRNFCWIDNNINFIFTLINPHSPRELGPPHVLSSCLFCSCCSFSLFSLASSFS